MSASHKNSPLCQAHLKKLHSLPKSEETRRKLSKGRKGKPSPRKGVVIPEAIREAHRTPKYLKLARQLRAKIIFPLKDTSIEVSMQNELTQRNIPFEKHKYLIGHQVDLFLKPNIIVECDGDYWHNRPETKKRDLELNECYRNAGYFVLRYWGHEINADVKKCVDELATLVPNPKS